eukprot:6179672-Pleurochrysis_carterae.AAC.3
MRKVHSANLVAHALQARHQESRLRLFACTIASFYDHDNAGVSRRFEDTVHTSFGCLSVVAVNNCEEWIVIPP